MATQRNHPDDLCALIKDRGPNRGHLLPCVTEFQQHTDKHDVLSMGHIGNFEPGPPYPVMGSDPNNSEPCSCPSLPNVRRAQYKLNADVCCR
jgi:hypothetical protein